MVQIALDVNGARRSVEVHDSSEPLLYVLRNDLRLTGAKFGCGLGQCGACTVIIDGQAVRSCQTPVSDVKGKITTIEGLGTPEAPHKVQAAFIEEQAAQCGYCTNGMVMTTAAFLEKNTSPSRSDVQEALGANLCRCGTHDRIIKAALRAANSK